MPYSHRFAKAAAAVLVLSLVGGCMISGSGGKTKKMAPPDAIALLRDVAGAERGRVDVHRTTTGLTVTVVARGLNAGRYGMHIHDAGLCDGPAFASAGPHWNPAARQHGRDNPAGAHAGDLPNLDIAAGEIGLQSFDLPGVMLTGTAGLIDTNGAALVIHAAPDDMMTDPTGNSGARMMCGVIEAAK